MNTAALDVMDKPEARVEAKGAIELVRPAMVRLQVIACLFVADD